MNKCILVNRCLYKNGRFEEGIRGPGRVTFKSLLWWMVFAIGLIVAGGCSQNGESQNDYMIRVGSGSVTVAEFNRAVANASEEAFPGEQNLEKSALQDLRVRVLNQMTEELIIVQRAQELGLQVSPDELDQAVNEVKADYPDATFEETLLENAVSLEEWKKKLAIRLIVQKVIARELIDKVQISTQDVADYYQKHYPNGLPEGEAAADINERIVTHLRQQKAEQSYQEWISNLRQSLPVDINQKYWEK